MVVPLRGRERTVGVVTFAATAFSGRRYGADELALARELAGRVALAVENARLYQRARKAVRARDAVLGMVAHDLRNPLTAITLGTSLALHHLGPRNGALRKHLQDIERSAGEMDRLIQDLLDVTRIEAGGLHLQLANEELGELLDAAAARFRLAAAERQIQIAIEPLEALPPVLVDQPRILQVFGNLMSNALRCTPEGGRIVIRATRREAEVLVSVSDTGIGIAPEDLPHVFDRFWQAGRSDLAGAGLGLAIVKGIVEAHGGRVCVESEVGVGTAFSFTLPLSGPAEIPGPLRPGGDVPSGIHGR
jgi:signal transduction histidine kinase